MKNSRAKILPLQLSSLWLALWIGGAIFCAGRSGGYHLESTLRPPQGIHFLGFDAFGRDLLIQVLRASWRSMLVAALTTLTACVAGILLGALIASSPQAIRFTFLRFLETVLAFPFLLFALAWAAIRGPGWGTLAFALLMANLPSATRYIYSRAREIAAEDFVLAARSLGAGNARIILRHLLPGLVSYSAVRAPNLFAQALLAEATLSFLGIGAPIGRDTWGSLLSQGKDYLVEAPHIAIGAGVPLVLTVLALQIFSEHLSRNTL